MHLVLVGPGILPIPPKGWGAVESLIWDYYTFIKRFHPDVDVHIVNEKEETDMILKIGDIKPDIVHLHYDAYIERFKKIKGPLIITTSHYAYIDQQGDLQGADMYFKTFLQFVSCGYPIFCLSQSILDTYASFGCPPELLSVHHNGANEMLYRYTETPKLAHRSAYVGKIEPRKRQFNYCMLADIDFIGNYWDERFPKDHPNWKGEWTKEMLQDGLTEYGNLVHLSEAEAHALVCCEALMCGLGLVVSERSTANLDRSLPFITVIPNDKVLDLDFIAREIERNRILSVEMRPQIRAYGISKFSWRPLVDTYVARLKELLEKRTKDLGQT